ncbi:hypothetical protein [Bacteroides cellulosilyticus]|uniref:hypothetical protein n=1 Tax=Bacteroides cellulosilyticus TaxID=246787 RepID=UPI003563F676
MKLAEEQIHKFAELERCYSQYFNGSVAPVMEQVRRELNDKQLEEMKEHSNSFAGIMATASTTPAGVGMGSSFELVTQTGIWHRVKTEDYIGMCQERIGKSEQITSDLKLIADEWRNELVSAVGREKYDGMCEDMGMDIAYAYTSYRVEQLMIDRLVQQNMPKSSLEYVMKSAAENSLLGLGMQLQRSPLDREISEASEKAYAPSVLEKGAGKVLSFGMDTVSTAGFSSWANLGRLALFEVASEGVGAVCDAVRKTGEEVSVEQIISLGVFGSESNVLHTFRRESERIDPHENAYIRDLDKQMKGRMRLIPEENLAWMKETRWRPEFNLDLETYMKKENSSIPSVVLPGKEEAYLALQHETKPMVDNALEKRAPLKSDVTVNDDVVVIDEQKVEPAPPQVSSSGQNGWGNLLSSFGLSGIGSVGRNMGYVVSMLPDLLVGLFTGKTKSLKLQDNLFPIASILMGLFTKNPLLKMLLVGMGGMNLMNKAGHEAIGKMNPDTNVAEAKMQEYKVYPNEALNARISVPEIKGNYLLATVDRVPCTIRIPDTTIAAYRAGALPLNTLANAVLLKSDELSARAQENYTATESRNIQGRGIG